MGVETKGLVPDALCKEVEYLNPVEIAQDRVRELQELGADLIICLSHLGYSYGNDKISDIKLAQQTEGIHLIIGGHTHTFLEKPTVEMNLKGNPTLINQVGWAGVQLGRIDFYVGKKFTNESQLIVID